VYRVFSVFSWANTLGFALIVPFGLVAVRVGSVQRTSGSILDYVVLLILAGGLFVSFGRAAWIGAAIAVLVPLFLSPSIRLTQRLLVTLGTLALVASSILRVDLGDRILEASNLPGREYIWSLVFQHLSDFIWTGQGFMASDYLARVSSDIPDAIQNIYLVVLYDYGIAGLVLFLATWFVFAVEIVLRTRGASEGMIGSRWGALGMLAGVLVYSLTGSSFFDFAPSIYIWLTLAITLALADLEVAARATAPKQAPSAAFETPSLLARPRGLVGTR
jgi:hypothetical protein